MNPIKLLSNKQEDVKILRGPFKGARVFLNPADSKRKIFGLYEHVLNDWLEEVAPQKDFAFDVGANDGYDTYGLAWLMSKGNQRPVDIISFEPGAGNMPSLLQPREWQEYSNCTITVVQKFVGAEDSDDYVTLDNFHKSHPELHGKSGLIKIDIEGFETEALNGAQDILQNDKHDWLIEIHGKDRVAEVAAHFTRVKRAFLIKDLSALPFIGNEHREIDTYWLMTI